MSHCDLTKMSSNRRRWSNELLNSLMSFQSKEGSELLDSLENNRTAASTDSLDDQSPNITSMLATLNLQKNPSGSQEIDKGSVLSNMAKSDFSDGSQEYYCSNNVMDLSMIEDNIVPTENSHKISATVDNMNININIAGKEGSELLDSLENNRTAASTDYLDDQSPNISSMLATLNLQKNPSGSQEIDKGSVLSNMAKSDFSDGSQEYYCSNNIMDLSMIEDNIVPKENSHKISATVDNMNININIAGNLNINIINGNSLNKHSNLTSTPFDQQLNLNQLLPGTITLSSDTGTISSCNSNTQDSIESQTKERPCTQYSNTMISKPAEPNHLFDLNEMLMENVTLSSDSETIKLSSCNSSTSNSVESQSMEKPCSEYASSIHSKADKSNHLLNLNEVITENFTLSSDSGTMKLSSCNSSTQNTAEKINLIESESSQHSIEVSEEDETNHRFFPSLDEHHSNQEMIAEITMPNVWNTLVALEEVLSSIDEESTDFHEHPQNPPHLLRRLSEKFKRTPTRFTEKLVSIIEDSIISSESPTKQYSGDTSGISLCRMTGEFRKLCKFIEDESMPEWAPSLMNMTNSYFEKGETPENKKNNGNVNTETPKNKLKNISDTPTNTFLPKPSTCFATPKNKILSNVSTPINQFTPDKSFEYWERVCNMMCKNQSSGKKKVRRSLSVPEPSKLSMDEMLTICERQMASLDDTMDIRSSEPCKKTDNEFKLQVNQAVPRSKSAFNLNHNEVKMNKTLISHDDFELVKKNKDLIEDEKLECNDSLLSLENSKLNSSKKEASKDYELLKNSHSKMTDNESFEEDFKTLLYSPKETVDECDESPFYDPDKDCSLLIELAKRRQRCLNTAKLMLEIDREDPIVNENNKYIETLYQIGNQEKTFTDIEDDTKFLNTLSHCMEYKKYFDNKSKPLINMLQKINSPGKLKTKAKSMVKSKKLLTIPLDPPQNLLNRQKKQELKNPIKNVQDKKMTPKIVPKNLSKTPSLCTKKSISNVQQTKSSSKLVPKALSKPTLQSNKKSLITQISQAKSASNVRSQSSIKTPQSIQKSAPIKKLSPRTTSIPSLRTTSTSLLRATSSSSLRATPTPSFTATPKSTQKRITPKVTTNLSVPKLSITPHREDNNSPSYLSPVLCERRENITPKSSPKSRFFVTPGKSPQAVIIGRKRPPTYFVDSKRPTPKNITYDSVKSPLNLYINSTDVDLIQNVRGRDNDRLLTPVSKEPGKSSTKLKFKLSMKENQSPLTPNFNSENNILPVVSYQSAKKVCLFDDKTSHLPSSITPNSKTMKLLKPIENKIVIRHKGRGISEDSKYDNLDPEASIRIQKMAEKTPTLHKK